MTELKCPFCGKDMEITMFARGREFVSCNNADCIISDWGGCSKQIITALIDTKKELDDILDKHEKLLKHIAVRANREQELRNKLDIAVDVLKDFANAGKESEQEWFGVAVKNNAQKALEQITALEQINQKENK